MVRQGFRCGQTESLVTPSLLWVDPATGDPIDRYKMEVPRAPKILIGPFGPDLPVTHIDPLESSELDDLTAAINFLFFTAYPRATGCELWAYRPPLRAK